METKGIGVLIKDTGEKARALQHWSDLGILHAVPDTDKKGRGRYREYVAAPYHGERKWALVASALNNLRVPLGEIRSIVDVMRKVGEPDSRGSSLFDAALTGRGDALVLIGKSMLDGKTCIDHCFMPAITEKTLAPPPPGAKVDPAAEKILGMVATFMSEHSSAYSLNLTKIFEPLRK